MRAQLIEYHEGGGEGLHPLVSTAVAAIKAETRQSA